MAGPDPVNAMLDELVRQVQDTHRAFILAQTCHVLGSGAVDAMADNACVSAVVGLRTEIEPIPVAQLRRFRGMYPEFVVEVFHGKMICLWHDLLSRVFSHYVDLHVQSERPFVELGRKQVRVDFAQPVPILDQIRESLNRGFDFAKYVERHKLLLRLRDGAGSTQGEADVVLRHVHIRNAIHHHRGVLHDFVFKELGCHEIVVLDDSGADQTLKAGDRVAVSIPEFDTFRRALLVIAQGWKH